MDEPKTIELTIDREFRDLIRPLMKDEYRHLEAALLSDGCQEPITVWKGVLLLTGIIAMRFAPAWAFPLVPVNVISTTVRKQSSGSVQTSLPAETYQMKRANI